MRSNRTLRLAILAIFAALTFVLGRFTEIPMPGGYFTLLDVGIFTVSMLLGKKEGALVGGLAAFLSDLTSGFPSYMFFSLFAHGGQGFLGSLTKHKVLNYFLASLCMIVIYMLADWVNYHTWGVVLPDILVNFVQTTAGYIIALLLVPLLKKAGIEKWI